jgi:hypothetical protein
MRQLSVIEFVTLDGVVQGLGSPDEDRDGGFEYGGWGAPYGDAALGQKAGEGMRAASPGPTRGCAAGTVSSGSPPPRKCG